MGIGGSHSPLVVVRGHRESEDRKRWDCTVAAAGVAVQVDTDSLASSLAVVVAAEGDIPDILVVVGTLEKVLVGN